MTCNNVRCICCHTYNGVFLFLLTVPTTGRVASDEPGVSSIETEELFWDELDEEWHDGYTICKSCYREYKYEIALANLGAAQRV